MQISEFGHALLYFISGIFFVVGGLVTSWLLSPKRPNPEKQSSYECGEEPLGSSWVQFNMRFYLMGLIFLIFEVEVLLLFPWATVFADPQRIGAVPAWGVFAAIEALIFVVVLLAGLAYVWVRGDLDWVRPAPLQPKNLNVTPTAYYTAFNQRMAAYQPQPAPAATAESADAASPAQDNTVNTEA
jgi:NADH-quinone oxidoreductase subunit A